MDFGRSALQEALNRSPEMVPPPSQDYGASPPQEEPYGQFVRSSQ